VRVKICGITSPEDARLAVEAGADAVGMVFADSPRQVTVAAAARIVGVLPPWVTAVGVFVNAPDREIAETARSVGLGAVQFHGDELPCQVADAARTSKVIKVFRVAGESDLADARDYLDQCRPHACLVDARVEGLYGGSGQQAPWDLVAAVRDEFWPLILSGGLTPENVAEAMRTVRPWGVEASSGVEREPGRKDPDLVRTFVGEVMSFSLDSPEVGDRE
jgi:phosphoribosylanthranilate isomerase